MVRESRPADRTAVDTFLADRGATRVARLGRLMHPLDHPALLAEHAGRLAGVLTYVIDGAECEILTIHASDRLRGAGTALVRAVEERAAESGCRRLWVLTTNDNLEALRFYQRRGFRMAELHPGAVDDARARLKPEIPRGGEHGIPLRDELILDKALA